MAEIVQDISEGNWLKFGTGKLSELCKLLPEESEVNPAQKSPSHLCIVIFNLIKPLDYTCRLFLLL